MTQHCSGILKKGQIHVTGPCKPGAAAAPRPASGQPEIRTVERSANDAVVEIRCTCGRHTYMHLRWSGAGTPVEPALKGTSDTTHK
ncbi:MAG: hypothetical protein NTY65_07110 [Planctomycetota bacterium]|jgi:hypothetical protein|nr:hypothetical protein [Planctomycetota bacterium]